MKTSESSGGAELAVTTSSTTVVVEVAKNFNTLSMLSLAVSLMATWEALCSTFGQGLAAGGPASLLYGFIVSFIGNLAIAASLAEQSSKYATAGGQYHFLAELSSPKHRAWLSWYGGWLTLLGWLVLTASAAYGAGTIIQGLITLNDPSYVAQRWHGTLIYMAIVIVALFLNIFASRMLPMLENAIMTLHVVFFFAIFIAILALPQERNSAEFVFTLLRNGSGWESDGVAWCLGLLTSAYIMVGYDSATHMSEEMKNPEIGVPRAMIGSLVLNGAMGFGMLIAILFGMGDIEQALASPTGFPIISIFTTMTRGNTAASTAMTCTIVISASAATVGLLASTSRSLWAFARDDAPPFASWVSRLDKRRQIPTNALVCCAVFICILGQLNNASTTTFAAILSLTVVALTLSYLLPILAMLYRRFQDPEQILYGPWRLSPAVGITANIVAVCYSVFVCIFLLFPTTKPITPQNMNYASVVLAGVLFLITVDWVFRGRKVFTGPKHM